MPMIGLGTWGLHGRDGYNAIRYALEVGYRHIDTATAYQNDAIVGRALRDSGLDRGAVFITTKLPAARAGHAHATLEASLRALGLGYTDLWLVHGPRAGQRHPAACGGSSSRRARMGSAGLLTCPTTAWRKSTSSSICARGQDRGEPDPLVAVRARPWAASRAPRARDRCGGLQPAAELAAHGPVLASIASRHGVTPSQVVLPRHLEHGIAVIPKSARPARIRSNIDVFGLGLPPAEVRLLDEAGC